VPETVLAALVRYAPALKDVEICHSLTIGSADYAAPEMAGHLRVNTMFISANVRRAVNEGRADFTPVFLSEFSCFSRTTSCPWMWRWCRSRPPMSMAFVRWGWK
jgi:acetyl-CoA hydrolase